MMITVIAEIKVKPGHRATVLQAIEKLVPLVLAEEGCGEYTPMVDSHTWPRRNCRRTRCLCWKNGKSRAHLEKHLQIEHMLKHRETIKDYVLGTEIYVLENAL
ncbi:antibiotic biosynthesis monooxygenase [Serratia marcescens]|uniref:Antibiotic biosynthesis monooxygenase n=1 Tax=Serratia marcescens TaxID=615 RepID=A0A939NQB5_SERMA|nr:antibiotic biosynthesis monooxygenase [Serratia marcescens]